MRFVGAKVRHRTCGVMRCTMHLMSMEKEALHFDLPVLHQRAYCQLMPTTCQRQLDSTTPRIELFSVDWRLAAAPRSSSNEQGQQQQLCNRKDKSKLSTAFRKRSSDCITTLPSHSSFATVCAAGAAAVPACTDRSIGYDISNLNVRQVGQETHLKPQAIMRSSEDVPLPQPQNGVAAAAHAQESRSDTQLTFAPKSPTRGPHHTNHDQVSLGKRAAAAAASAGHYEPVFMHARCIREMLSTLPVRGVRMSNKDRLLLRTVAAALNEMAANSCGGPDGDDADEDDGERMGVHRDHGHACGFSSSGRSRGKTRAYGQVDGGELIRASAHMNGRTTRARSDTYAAMRDGTTSFPDPIWLHILDFLAAEDLYPVMMVSRHFKGLTNMFLAFYKHWKLRAAEDRDAPKPYMHSQRNLNAKMRAILLDWITDVHVSLNFKPDTLYRTAQILDKFLAGMGDVSRDKLQLIGVTCFRVAAKLLEDNPPDPDDCAYWTDNAFSGEEVKSMEGIIRSKWRPNWLSPIPHDFLEAYLSKAGLGKLACCRARYYCERMIQEHAMLNYKPSRVAASAVLMALRAGTPSGPAWPAELKKFSGYSEDQLADSAAQMWQHVREVVLTLSGRRLDAVKRKYQAGEYLGVSKMDPPAAAQPLPLEQNGQPQQQQHPQQHMNPFHQQQHQQLQQLIPPQEQQHQQQQFNQHEQPPQLQQPA